MAVAAYKKVTRERIVREKFAMQKKQELDYLSGMQSAEELGIEKGKKLGIDEGKRETARALKAQGISVEIIAKATGLSFKEIEKL